MDNRRYSFIDATLWVLTMYLLLHVRHIEMRVDESEQPARREQPPASTPKPEPHKQYLNNGGKCFHMPRSECPPEPNCTKVDSMSVFCCDLDSARLKEALASAMTPDTRYLHVRDSTLDELNVSMAVFSRLSSMAFTDGSIGQIVGSSYPSLACLNISNNGLTTAKLQPSIQHPFNLSVLDASANNLTEFPLNLVHSNKKISVDLSGNSYIRCKQFLQVINNKENVTPTLINYNTTDCAILLNFNWFSDTKIVRLKQLNVLGELAASCRNMKPSNHNCSCRPHRLWFPDDGGVVTLVTVDCSRRHLTALPTNLPPNTRKLNVSYNDIKSLQNVDDPSYDSVRDLIADHNDITNLLELEETKFLDNCMSLSLRYNKLTTIHTQVFSKLVAYSYRPAIYIGGNIIYCECDTAKTLKPWLLKHANYFPDYQSFKCEDNTPVVELDEEKVCSR